MIAAGIRVNGKEEVRLYIIRDIRSFFQRNERVVRARKNHLRAGQALLNDFSQPQRHVQAEILLHQSRRPDRSGFAPAAAFADLDFKFFAVEPALRTAAGAPPATEPMIALLEFPAGAGSGFSLEFLAATFWTDLPALFDPALASSPSACSPRFALAVRTVAVPEFPYRSIKSCVGLFFNEAV